MLALLSRRLGRKCSAGAEHEHRSGVESGNTRKVYRQTRPDLALTLMVLLGAGSGPVRSDDHFPELRKIDASDSVLVVAPHPDDESLCCGGLIDAARRAGARVAIVWITDGDAFKWDAVVVERTLRPRPGTYEALARQRDEEARTAADILGVPQDSIFFLGYPDRGVLHLLFDYYYPGLPWRSKFTGASAVPYLDAVDLGAQYDGEDLERDFRSVVERVRPTLVLAPSFQDTHPDHRGAGILAMRIMKERGESQNLRFWIVHGGRHWPAPGGYHPEQPQTVAPRGAGMSWVQLPLDEIGRSVKLAAVQAHRTQMRVMGRVMESHVRSTELYSRTPAPPQSLCALPEPCEFEDGTIQEESGL